MGAARPLASGYALAATPVFIAALGLYMATLLPDVGTWDTAEFQAIGTSVGKLFSAALTGGMTVDKALAEAQSTTEREMKRAGYPK